MKSKLKKRLEKPKKEKKYIREKKTNEKSPKEYEMIIIIISVWIQN